MRFQGGILLKLNMIKAYDRVKYGFFFKEKTMFKMGFVRSFVDLVLRCISSVSCSVCLNGKMGERFKPTRGFECLLSLMRLASREGLIKGVRVCCRGPIITHLLFVDDCILFRDATVRGAQNLKVILHEYEICTGQYINFEKSIIFCISNVKDQKKE
ncbi:reverse transcriptase [Gossypium australe]|uniref:Reverse transcriptase n=1 Tax=Gossypium australe TaxID=47621 RepID=A0A5B6WIP4_9ROSI|nr:reverse transcriptase [Gossypium australe]